METKRELLVKEKPLRVVTSSDAPAGSGTLVTRDHEVIQRWANDRQAEPATGEATSSGPATIDVKDGGAGIRFNFPGLGRFRPIGWDEWFDYFDRHELMFVYEEQTPDGGLGARYRLVKADELKDRI